MSLLPDFEIDAENLVADEWLHNEIVRRSSFALGRPWS
jgi:hypothetical protein